MQSNTEISVYLEGLCLIPWGVTAQDVLAWSGAPL